MSLQKLEPIGFVKSGGGNYPQEAPRQAVFARNSGVIELLPGHGYEQALEDDDTVGDASEYEAE